MEIDLSKYELQEEFPTLPAGTYPVAITKVELKESKSGNKMVVVDFKPTGADFKRYMVRDYFTLGLQVAMERLKAVAHATGLGDKLEIERLQGKQLTIKTSVEEDSYGTKSRILAFMKPETGALVSAVEEKKEKGLTVEQAAEIKMPWENQ